MIAALLALAVTASPSPLPTDPGTALIVDSGSTNTGGYQITVHTDGTVAVAGAHLAKRTTIPVTLAQRFFADLRAAGDLSALPSAHCMKSASFGSTLRVAYLGKASPDLSCPSPSTAGRTLTEDTQAITDAVITPR